MRLWLEERCGETAYRLASKGARSGELARQLPPETGLCPFEQRYPRCHGIRWMKWLPTDSAPLATRRRYTPTSSHSHNRTYDSASHYSVKTDIIMVQGKQLAPIAQLAEQLTLNQPTFPPYSDNRSTSAPNRTRNNRYDLQSGLQHFLLVLLFLLVANPLYGQVFGTLIWKNGSAVVSRDSGFVHWTVSSSDGTRGYQQRVSKVQATGLWMLAHGATSLPDSTRSLPFDYDCCRINFMYSKTSVTGTLVNKELRGYWQPSKPLTVQQALTVFDWLMYAADSVKVPPTVVDLR